MAGRPVLVLGATGVFGSRICRLLARRGAGVVGVGRNAERLAALARETGAATEAAVLPDAIDGLLARHAPVVVVDASGPFQDRDYGLPRACIARGVPYIDLSDGREDVAAIGTLDRLAREAGVAVISGASTVPGLSSAVIDHLAPRFAAMESVEIAVAPGNDSPRGRAVVDAVLSWLGRPVPRWQDGAWTAVTGWQDLRRVPLGTFGTRLLAACDVPDLVLLPQRHPALRTVSFHAGLEIPLYQWGMWLLAWPVRWGLLRDPGRLAGPLRHIALWTRSWGTATGAMRVAIAGLGHDGRPRHAVWLLQARSGDGPMIPALPAAALALAIARGKGPPPGARPCLGEISLEAMAALFEGLDIGTTVTDETPPSLFRQALGAALDVPPPAIRALHDLSHTSTARGLATIEHGDNPLARLGGRLRLLPRAGSNLPVAVTFTVEPGYERWRRDFDGHVEASTLGDPEPGHVTERWGPLAVRLRIEASPDGLDYGCAGCRVFGLPLPRRLWLGVTGRERLDPQGRFGFDVAIALPFGLRIVRYRGWLALP